MQIGLKHFAIFALLLCIPSAHTCPLFIFLGNPHNVHAIFLISSHTMKASIVSAQRANDLGVSNLTFSVSDQLSGRQVISISRLSDPAPAPRFVDPLFCFLRT
jgi:hypothetical protein